MELRYNSLIKEQDKILTEAHQALDKKVDIEMKHIASQKREVSKKKDPETSNQLKNIVKSTKEN